MLERNTWKHGFKSVCALMPPPPPHPLIHSCGKYRSITARGILLGETYSAHKLKKGYTLILKLLIMEDSVKIRNSRPSRFTFSGLRRMYMHARSLLNFYCQFADRHMNLKFMRRVSERERAIRQFVIVKNKLMSVFNASVLLLTMNFVITLSK